MGREVYAFGLEERWGGLGGGGEQEEEEEEEEEDGDLF